MCTVRERAEVLEEGRRVVRGAAFVIVDHRHLQEQRLALVRRGGRLQRPLVDARDRVVVGPLAVGLDEPAQRRGIPRRRLEHALMVRVDVRAGLARARLVAERLVEQPRELGVERRSALRVVLADERRLQLEEQRRRPMLPSRPVAGAGLLDRARERLLRRRPLAAVRPPRGRERVLDARAQPLRRGAVVRIVSQHREVVRGGRLRHRSSLTHGSG